jgi:transcriptional regulator with XRE-family HTH domain
MTSANILREARRRAGLTQHELADRLGIKQPAIARWEGGRVVPSVERLRELVGACGLDLTLGIATADESYDADIIDALALGPGRRLARRVRESDEIRRLRAYARRSKADLKPFDALGVLNLLDSADLRYILIGEVAEVLRGSPLGLSAGTMTIVPDSGQRETLTDVIAEAGGQFKIQPATAPLDADSRWALTAYGAELVVAPAPPGTRGYTDLRRYASELTIDEAGHTAPVAALIDLVRISQAGDESARARTPALRRTLDLSESTAPG